MRMIYIPAKTSNGMSAYEKYSIASESGLVASEILNIWYVDM